MRIPGPKWGAGRPPLETPKSRCAILAELLAASRLELRCRWGKRERVRARHDCRTSTASVLGACTPCPPTFPKGKSPPIMRASAWDRVRNGFCGNAPANLPEAPAAQAARSSVTLLARLCRRHSSATAGGNPKGGAALFGQSLPTFCWPESRGPARPERVEGRNYNFKERERGSIKFPVEKPLGRL